MSTAKIFTVKNSKGDSVDVCARIERDENGENDFVKISTFHIDADGLVLYQDDSLRFENQGDQFGMCEMFIDNFSADYAAKFALSFEF